jgi:hypothetical protein
MSHLFQLQKTVLTSLEVKNTSSDLVNVSIACFEGNVVFGHLADYLPPDCS